MIPPSTPILDTLSALKLALDVPAHVRTAGDLVAALERGEIAVDEKTVRKFALLNWMDSPAFLESLERNFEGLRTLTKPGVTFTEEQRKQIEALPDDEAAKKIRDILA